MSRKLFSFSVDVSLPDTEAWPRWLRALLPAPGTVLFTFLIVASLLWASNAGALPLRSTLHATASTGTIAYQGRLANAAGEPLSGTAIEHGSRGAEEQRSGGAGVQGSRGEFSSAPMHPSTPAPQHLRSPAQEVAGDHRGHRR